MAKKTKHRKGLWQYQGTGPVYSSVYLWSESGERSMALVGYKPNGILNSVPAESWQMLKKAGWVRVKR